MSDPIVSFRISSEEYDKLKAYAEQNNMTISETVRKAVKWMQILYTGRHR